MRPTDRGQERHTLQWRCGALYEADRQRTGETHAAVEVRGGARCGPFNTVE